MERGVERSAVRGRMGLCCASFGEARAGLEERVPGVHVPSTVELELLSPKPGSPEAFPSGTANPVEPRVWLGILWLSSGQWEREAPSASRRSRAGGLGEQLRLARRAVCLVLQESRGLLSVEGLYLFQNFPNCGAGRDSGCPPPDPFGELGALQLSAASRGARRAGAPAAVETQPRGRSTAARGRQPALNRRLGLSCPGLSFTTFS